ncbi:MAG: hypothetical protein RLZZ111_644 [Planctomycetota bacterium]|jgi:membrane-associated protease RseP (regulator of RpoE activity)
MTAAPFLTVFAGRRFGSVPAAVVAVVAALALAGGGPPAGAAEVPDSPPDAAQIDGWIEQLAAPQFSQREAATRSLVAAGRPVIEPVSAAIRRGDLEVSSRAVEILRDLLAAEDTEVAKAAEAALEAIAEGEDGSVAALAEATLDFHTLGLAEAARERLEMLGATITEGFLPSGQRGLQVLLNASWTGTTEDLRLLARLRGVAQVGVHGVRLDEAGLAVLGRLRGVEQVQLYGTGASDAAVAALAQKLPGSKVDVRKGGKLGVAGMPAMGPCTITHVQDGSAAARAGLQIGDVVQRIDGTPVGNFDALTELVGRRGPGEKIEMEVDRGGQPGVEPQRLKLTVELGGWD